MKASWAAITLSAAVAACALIGPQTSEVGDVRDIIGDAASAVRATPEEQRRRLAHALQRYGAIPNVANGVRYGALLASLPPPLGDEEKAAAVLSPIAAQRPESPLTQLAGMLAAGLAERQRLARDLRTAAQRAESEARRAQAEASRADSQASRAEAAVARAESAERREAMANERATTLQGQVDALKSIERSILQREERRRTLKR